MAKNNTSSQLKGDYVLRDADELYREKEEREVMERAEKLLAQGYSAEDVQKAISHESYWITNSNE